MPHATPKELEIAIDHILGAPKDGAAIEMLCRRPDFGQREFVQTLDVSVQTGIKDERWSHTPWLKLPDGSGNPAIQVCFLQKRVLDLVWRDREGTVHPGDTFIVDMDLSESNLPAGTLLQAGTAVLEVSEVFNEACVKWKTRYGAAAKDWVTAPQNRAFRLRGILARVHQDGQIINGAPLRRLS